MGLWSTFSGKTGKKVAGETKATNDAYANQGYADSSGYLKEGYDSAIGRMDPYAQGGQRGYEQYTNMLGLNGGAAQQGAMGAYQAYNPYMAAEQDRLMKAGDRRAAATGQFGSGLNAMARARTSDEVANRNYTQYMGQLQGLGQQGMQAAGAQAGYDQNYGQGRANLRTGLTNQLMGNQNAYAQQYTQADGVLWNNMMGVAGLGIDAVKAMYGVPPMPKGNTMGGR